MTDTRQRESDTVSTALSTKDVADAIGRTTATVRQYTREFQEFLSSAATPPEGARRTFAQDDLRVLYAASKLLDAGLQYGEVRQRLRDGAADLQEFQPPEEPEAEEPPTTGTAMISVAEFGALVAPLERAAAEWRQIAEERAEENRELREEIRRLREELRRPEERPRSWLDRLLGR
jgi:DNA-binding transcriptional MerR regulator